MEVAKLHLGWFILFCILPVQHVRGSSFLIIFGPEYGSHFMMCARIGEQLASRGHSVTYLINDNLKEGLNKYQLENVNLEIYPTRIQKTKITNLQKKMSKESMEGNLSFQTLAVFGEEMLQLLENSTHDVLGNSALMRRLQESNFDLVFCDILYIYPAFIAEVLQVPFIPMSFMVATEITVWIMRADISTSYYPTGNAAFDHRMSFQERLQNTVRSKLMLVFQYYFIYRRMHQVMDVYGIQKSATEVMGQAEMWFVRTHFALDFPRSLPSHAVAIGGLLTQPAGPLNQDLESFIESSGGNGVIVFSLGSYVNHMDAKHVRLFQKAFSELRESVIWRYVGDTTGNKSDNVVTMPWIPQNDLIGHNKTRLLIYHCGSNGVFEALYHGVPILCLPLFADQFGVAARVVSRGIGVKLDIATLTSESLVSTIRHVIDEPSYRYNVRQLSSAFKEDPNGAPLDRAIHRMEFTAKYGNASHLRSAANELNYIQYNLIDVYVTFMISTIVSVLVMYKCLKVLCSNLSNVLSVEKMKYKDE